MAQAGRSPHVRAAYRLTCGCAALGSRDGAAALVPSPAPAPGPASSPASRPRTSPTHPIPRSGLGPAPRPQPRPGPCPFPSAGLSPGALPARPFLLAGVLGPDEGIEAHVLVVEHLHQLQQCADGRRCQGRRWSREGGRDKRLDTTSQAQLPSQTGSLRLNEEQERLP